MTRHRGEDSSRKKEHHGLGAAFVNAKKKKEQTVLSHKHVSDSAYTGASVLEQSSLDDYLTTAALAQSTFEAAHGRVDLAEDMKALRTVAQSRPVRDDLKHIVVPIPRKPQWTADMDPEVLWQAENEAFLDWRRSLAELEETMDAVMTPFERNVDFWRQLWRVVERSDVVVQILDARDPLFFRSVDLEDYVVNELGKKCVLVLNKADFLSPTERDAWALFFKEQGVEMVFFSALAELTKKELLDAEEAKELLDAEDADEDAEEGPADADADAEEGVADGVAHGSFESAHDVLNVESLFAHLEAFAHADGLTTIGMVGYPNVGKSSLINALLGVTKVSMSKQPGHTKHFQTHDVPDKNIRLCDCPGLVFPSIVATKAHLVIRGVNPVDIAKDTVHSAGLIVSKMGVDRILRFYKCVEHATKFRHETRERVVLSALAMARHHFLAMFEPDLDWAARKILRDFNAGSLLHVELPPGMAADVVEPGTLAEQEDAAEAAFMAYEGVGDVSDFIEENLGHDKKQEALAAATAKMSKRQLRQLQKGMVRGRLQARGDGTLDPFNIAPGHSVPGGVHSVASVGLGAEAQRRYQSGKR